MARNRFIELADRIEARITKDPSFVLPTLLDVSRREGVSYVTAWKAFRELVRRNVVQPLVGRRCVIHPLIRPESSALGASALDRLAAKLKSAIDGGIYQVGKPLPKVDSIVVAEHCARTTVLQAYRRLSEDSQIHKVRNRWIVGAAPSPRSRVFRLGEWGAVGALMAHPDEWTREVIGNAFVHRFTGPLLDELSTHSFQVIPLARYLDAQTRFLAVPTGLKECGDALKRLGDRYCGTFIWCSHPREEKAAEWIAFLGSMRKPVVYMDHTDQGGFLTRTYVGVGKQYCRMHLAERMGIRLVLGALRDMGHTSIGLHNVTSLDWAVRRNESILACAREEFPELRVTLSETAEDAWTIRDWTGMHDALLSSCRGAAAALFDRRGEYSGNRNLRQAVLKNSASLVGLFREHGVTALIAASDRFAREYYSWGNFFGVNMPEHLSIVSFDNEQASACFPISTVDFGCARLGYLAAHIMIGDINVHADRSGSIAGTCTLVDRGSIGRPAQTRRLLEHFRP